MLEWEEGKDFVGLKKTDIRDERIDPPEPVPPGESQTPGIWNHTASADRGSPFEYRSRRQRFCQAGI